MDWSGVDYLWIIVIFFQLFLFWVNYSFKPYSFKVLLIQLINVTKDLIGLKQQGDFISNWLHVWEGIKNEDLLMSAEKEINFRCRAR